MIERVVLVKLKEGFTGDTKRREVARHSREVLSRVAGVRGVSVGVPGDDACAKVWDLYIVVRFDGVEDVPAYISDPQHRAYVDEYLRPKIETIKAWNFGAA